MSRTWNGESLVNELSALLGDTSAAFKLRTLGWLNDVIFDISSRHDWGHHLTKGKKYLSALEEVHSLEISPPDAPEVELASGGFLAAGATYSVLVTYVQSNGVESLMGKKSVSLVTTADLKTIKLSDIPTSSESLVTKRRIYLKKNSGEYYLHTEMDDNFETMLTISEDTASLVEPPDYESIRKLKGSPFFEKGPSTYLTYKDIDQLRLMVQGAWSPGNPEYFSPVEANSVSIYPIPSSEAQISFNYYRNAFRLYNSQDSQPDLPVYLKPALKAGVIALGYEYRERAGASEKVAKYELAITTAINKGGRVANIEYSIRDVYGNFNGSEVN